MTWMKAVHARTHTATNYGTPVWQISYSISTLSNVKLAHIENGKVIKYVYIQTSSTGL